MVWLPIAHSWQAAHERPYFFAGTAKGAEVATWKQAARDEMAAGVRTEYAIVLLDLVKAFHRCAVRLAASPSRHPPVQLVPPPALAGHLHDGSRGARRYVLLASDEGNVWHHRGRSHGCYRAARASH